MAIKRPLRKEVPFSIIGQGEWFYSKENDELFKKTSLVYSEDDSPQNAICEEGFHVQFDGDDRVCPVEIQARVVGS